MRFFLFEFSVVIVINLAIQHWRWKTSPRNKSEWIKEIEPKRHSLTTTWRRTNKSIYGIHNIPQICESVHWYHSSNHWDYQHPSSSPSPPYHCWLLIQPLSILSADVLRPFSIQILCIQIWWELYFFCHLDA